MCHVGWRPRAGTPRPYRVMASTVGAGTPRPYRVMASTVGAGFPRPGAYDTQKHHTHVPCRSAAQGGVSPPLPHHGIHRRGGVSPPHPRRGIHRRRGGVPPPWGIRHTESPYPCAMSVGGPGRGHPALGHTTHRITIRMCHVDRRSRAGTPRPYRVTASTVGARPTARRAVAPASPARSAGCRPGRNAGGYIAPPATAAPCRRSAG